MAAAIHRVGKVYVREDGMTVVDGWYISAGVGDPPPRAWTDDDQAAWMDHIAELTRAILEGEAIEPPDPDTEIFDGWTLAHLAELSITLGEGTVLP